MLNTETKRRIDNARDILVGKVPDPKTQVEQITFAMIYKFMDDMDQLSESLGGKASFFANGYEQYAWSKLLDKKLSGADRMDLYVRALEGMSQNPFIPQLFRDVFKGAFLPYRDSETLNLFLKEINGFTYDHSEDLGDAYEYLLSIFATQGKAGQFRTPRHIIDFIVDCVDPDLHDTVLDPACGTAGFLISAYKHVLEKYKEDPLSPDQKQRLTENFVGYDISPDMVRLSRVNMYLHTFPNPTIYEYDTLTNEDRWDDTFDVILANPPFMTPKGGIRPHKRFAVRANRSEVLFVDYIAEHLNVGGRAGVIVPEGIIFQSSNAYKALRKMLVEAGYLYAVVSLPAGVFNPYSGVKTSILLMDKDLAQRVDSILFVKVENDGYGLGAQRRPIEQNDLPEALNIIQAFQTDPEREPGNTQMALTVKKAKLGENGDFNLSGERYRIDTQISKKWPLMKLKEITKEIKSGFAFGKSVINGEGVPHIRPMNINNNGQFVWEGTKYIPKNEMLRKEEFKIRKGDILFNNTNSKELVGKTCFIREDINGGFSNHITRIRVEDDICNPLFLSLVLHSYWNAQKFLDLCNKWVGQAGINTTSLSNIQIPLPPLEVQQELVDEIEGYQRVIDGARQVVENYKPVINIDPDWPLVKLGDVCETQYGHSEAGKEVGDTRFVRITDINDRGELTQDDKKFINLSEKSKPYIMERGDVVIARTGATYGKTLFFNSNEKSVFAGYLIRLLFDNKRIVNKYFFYFSLSDHFNRQKERLVTGGGQPQFNARAIKQIEVPLPNIGTQMKIVEQIDSEMQLVNSNTTLIECFEEKIVARIKSVWEIE